MLNQKGQAFSVFELMIAAIVAIAILMVLMNIMGGVGGDATGGAKDAIATGLSSVDTGGSTTTQPFTLQDGVLITSRDFSDDGFDPQSIIFAVDAAVPSNGITFGLKTGSDDIMYSSFLYDASTNFRANARVICELTGSSLTDTLNDLEITGSINDDYSAGDPIDLCGDADSDYEYSPCCVVIIQRAR